MNIIKSEIYKNVAEESSDKTANNFFGYLLEQYHYQPSESLEECPEMYDELSDILDSKDYTMESLHELIDKYFSEILYNQRKKGLISILESSKEQE